ncbi:MAG: HD domain-containing phosphohydrolase [Caldimonas sp.]
MTKTASNDTGVPPEDAFLQSVASLGAREPLRTSQAIYNANGIMLLQGGARVDQGLFDRLVSHRLMAPLDECVEAEASVDGAALRDAAEALLVRLPFFGLMGRSARVRVLLLDALAGVPLPKPVALQLTLMRSAQPALFEHSVLMGLLAAYLVLEGGGLHHDVGMAATAGVLHDIGMLHIDPGLLEAIGPLSGDELKPIYVHPMTASMVMDRFSKQYPKDVLRAVVEHHERLDGSGYPRGLVGDAISPLGQVLSIAEVVTAMFDGSRRHAEQRVSLLLRVNAGRYAPVLVASIQRLLRALPPASEGAAATLGESVSTVRVLDALLTGWSEVAAKIGAALRPAEQRLLKPVGEQTATLRRMMLSAGITPDQLDMLEGDTSDDPVLRLELWALAEELRWQLRATANNLHRRWHGGSDGIAYPPTLASWIDAVKALDPGTTA